MPPSTQACARAGSGHRGMTLPLGTRRSVRRMLNGLLGSSRGRVNETAGRQSGICSLRIFSRGRPPFFPSVTGMQRATAEPLCRGRGPDTFADACVTSAEGSSSRLLPTFCACGPRGRASLWFWCCGLLDGAGLLRTHASSEKNSLSDYGRPARGPRGRAALVLVSAART